VFVTLVCVLAATANSVIAMAMPMRGKFGKKRARRGMESDVERRAAAGHGDDFERPTDAACARKRHMPWSAAILFRPLIGFFLAHTG
jgi:hypothetical protein